MHRVHCGLAFLTALVICATAPAQEKNLLDKFQKRNQQAKEQLAADIQALLKKVRILEKKNPEAALELVREARDQWIGTRLYNQEEEKQFYQPLWDKIELLKELTQARRVQTMSNELDGFKNSIANWSAALEHARTSGASAKVAGVLDAPALLAFRNGTYSYCMLKAWPNQTVECTVDGNEKIFLPAEVVGVKTMSGYYLFHEKMGNYRYVTNGQAFVLTAFERLNPATPELPGHTPISLIPKGSAAVKPEAVEDFVKLVFTKGVQHLPMYFDKEKGFHGPAGEAMRAARDALVEATINHFLKKASEESKGRFKRVITESLNARPGLPLAESQQEQLLEEMYRSMPNAGPWPRLLLAYVNQLVQHNQSPVSE